MKEEERRRPRERHTHTHTHTPQSQGEILNCPSSPPPTPQSSFIQTKAATSKQGGRDFFKSGVSPASCSSSKLLLPIYPS